MFTLTRETMLRLTPQTMSPDGKRCSPDGETTAPPYGVGGLRIRAGYIPIHGAERSLPYRKKVEVPAGEGTRAPDI